MAVTREEEPRKKQTTSERIAQRIRETLDFVDAALEVTPLGGGLGVIGAGRVLAQAAPFARKATPQLLKRFRRLENLFARRAVEEASRVEGGVPDKLLEKLFKATRSIRKEGVNPDQIKRITLVLERASVRGAAMGEERIALGAARRQQILRRQKFQAISQDPARRESAVARRIAERGELEEIERALTEAGPRTGREITLGSQP